MEKIWIMGWWVERDSLDTSNILGNVPIFSTVWWIWSYDPLDQHSPLFHKNGSCSIVTKIHTLVAATLILYCMVWLSGVQRGSLIHCNVEKSCGTHVRHSFPHLLNNVCTIPNQPPAPASYLPTNMKKILIFETPGQRAQSVLFQNVKTTPTMH